MAEAAAVAAYICCKYGFDVVDWAAEGGILKKVEKIRILSHSNIVSFVGSFLFRK